MTDTPETDEATLRAIDIEGGGEFDAVHVQVSKRLERERDGARKDADTWKASHDNQVALKAMLMERPDLGDRASRIAELIRERDEIRAQLREEQQLHVQTLNERDELRRTNEGLQLTFDLRWKADQRAIKRWQAAHPGNDLTWPDHADMVVWLMERYDAERLLTVGLADIADGTGCSECGGDDQARLACEALAAWEEARSDKSDTQTGMLHAVRNLQLMRGKNLSEPIIIP